MNIERLKAVADAIESAPAYYDQEDYGCPAEDADECRSPGCIAGWATALWYSGTGEHSRVAGENALDLTSMQAGELFCVYWPVAWCHNPARHVKATNPNNGTYIPTAAGAVDVLRRIAAGEIKL